MSTDDDDRQAGMFARWPTPNVLYVADPEGASYLRPLDLFDPDERDGIALPGLVVIAPDGREAYRYVGRDFADRTTDDELLAAVDALALDAIDPPAGGPAGEVPADLDRFFSPDNLVMYFRGNRFGAAAIGRRLTDPDARAIAREHRVMCDATLEAWNELRERTD